MTRPSDAPAETVLARRMRGARAYLQKHWLPVVAGSLALLTLALWATCARPAQTPHALDGGVDALVAAPSIPVLHGPNALDGLVLDDRGRVLAGARLRLTSLAQPDAIARDAQSDAQGAFHLEDLPSDELLSLEATHDGHEGKEHTFRAGETTRITFVLARQGELAVALRDVPGQPVEGAEILLTGAGLWPALSARADAHGEQVFVGLAAGQYRVRARRGERVARPSELVAVVPGARTATELELEQGATLAGSVFDRQTGAPLAGAQVAIQDLTPGIGALAVTTDAHGSFTARGLWPGPVRVEAQHESYAPTTRDLMLPHALRLELALAGAAAIAGVVVDERGQPLAGVRLSLTTEEGLPVELPGTGAAQAGHGELGVTSGPVPEIPLFQRTEFALGTLAAESDSDGNFRIARLAPRPLVLHAARQGFVPERVVVNDLKPHSEKRDLRVVLRPAGHVIGRIVDVRGRPLAGVYVAARSSDGERSALTDDSGEYTVRDVLGEVNVEAQPDGHTMLRCRVRVEARAEARCDLTAETAVHELAVRVVDEYGVGLEGALVTLTARSQSAAPHTAAQFSRRDGRLALRELPAPPYSLDVTLTGHLSVNDLAVQNGEREVRVQLARAGSLAGFVVDTLGRAVPGAFVSTDEGEASSETDAQGTFSLEGVAPGAHTLIAQHAQAGEGHSAQVRARPSERLDGVRIVLSGRFSGEDATSGKAGVEVRRTKPQREERAAKSDYALELRGRAVVVTEVAEAGAAAAAGLRAGDVIAAVDGETPLSPAHARGLLRDPPGRTATVRVLRDGRPSNLRYRRPPL